MNSVLNEMSGSSASMLLIGTGAVVMVLVAMFYFVRRSVKGEYAGYELLE